MDNQPLQPQEETFTPGNRQAVIGVVILALLTVGVLVILLLSKPVSTPRPTSPDNATAFNPTVFEALPLEAKAVYMYDLNHKEVIYAHHEEIQLPLASLTKLMTAIVAAESLPNDTVVTIQASDLAPEGDSGLLPQERWRARDLLDFMLLVSSNDSAYILASAAGARTGTRDGSVNLSPREVFVGAMNEKAIELGLSQTYFLNETGLDKSEEVSGGYGSARDVAQLFAYALEYLPSSLNATSYPGVTFTSLENRVHAATNTNEMIHGVPALIASKTGYTDLAGGNLAIAFDAGINRPVVIVVLGSSRDGRFRDVELLSAAVLASLQDASVHTP
jgi:D-alanyl-D-alanine carboxypeptidase